jgi:aliphatic sulfonates family ABC transporter substrate-binding protein
MTTKLTRRSVGMAALAIPAILALPRLARAAGPVRLGYQKNGALVILQQKKWLEQSGMDVQWVYFTSGPPMLEALNAGAIDFAATGDTPPIFAQAAGSKLVYVASQPMGGLYEGILVKKDSPIHTLADLRGKRVTYTKGSSGHYCLLASLGKAGLTPADIESVTLQPPDSSAAFAQRRVDAWSVWDPFFALGELDPANRVLTYEHQVTPSNRFFLARTEFANSDPASVEKLIAAIGRVSVWAKAHPEELAQTMTQITGVPLAAEKLACSRDSFTALPMSESIIATQQSVADTFYKAGVLPRPINVRDIVWTPPAGDKKASTL